MTRGRPGVTLVTSDAHTGLVDAIRAALPGASWQRRRTPNTANLMSICPQACVGRINAMLHSVFDQIQKTLPEVHAHPDEHRGGILALTAFPEGGVGRSGRQPNERSTAKSPGANSA